MKKIKQIEESQVMSFLLNDKPVYRLNIENDSLADLRTKTIQVIKRDMEKDCYLYFTIEEKLLRGRNIFQCDVCGRVFESPDEHITCPYCGRELYIK